MRLPKSIRALARTPLVTAAAVGALALALGAVTLVASVADGVLLRTLPFRDPDRLAVIWETNAARGRFENVVSPANYLHWKDAATTFDQMAAVTLTFRTTLGEPGPAEEVPQQLVSGRLFELLGVGAARGRTFTPEEDRQGNDAALISHRLWDRRYGADPAIVGKRVRLGGEPKVIVGVMPPGFAVLDPTVDVWMPIGFDERHRMPRGRFLIALGRLRDGATFTDAQSEMTAISTTLTSTFPDFNTGWSSRVVPIHGQVVGKIQPALLLLIGATSLVLLISYVNVANLLLARGVARRREIAVRSALGEPRWRIAAGLLAESAAIALSGAALGWVLALAGLRALQASSGAEAIPRIEGVVLDWRTAAVACSVAAISAVLAGLLPAIVSSRSNLVETLRDSGRTSTSGTDARLRRGLVVAEVALAVILLAGAGLLIRSLVRLLEVDPGFKAAGVLTARVSLAGEQFQQAAARTQFLARLEERLRAIPSVTHAGAVSFLPTTGIGAGTGFTVVGRPDPPPGQDPVADIRIVSGDYFGALGISVRLGRTFTTTDTEAAPGVVIVNDALVRTLFPADEPIGHSLQIAWNSPGPHRIVGVVGDVRHESLETPARPTIYFVHAQSATSVMNLTVRTTTAPETLAAELTSLVRALDASVPVSAVQPMAGVMAGGLATRRMVMSLLTTLAAVALLLAGVGIYAVMAYSVAERRSELAIRMALGADARRIYRLVLGQSSATIAIGLAIGVAGALAATRLMTTLLYDVTPADPVALAGALAALGAVGLIATWVPGRAAASVDPALALQDR
jgi:putative ABC transport system permease protein